MNIFIMGAPGSGKGTFSSRIRDTYNLNHISTGDIFRENISKGTPLGQQARQYSEKGLLVPDEITNAMVADYLRNLPDRKTAICWTAIPGLSPRRRPLKNSRQERRTLRISFFPWMSPSMC